MHAFSGRRDPVWPLTPAAAARLVAAWQALAPLDGSPPPPPPALGYRGCSADDAATGRHWSAYGGLVTCAEEARSDPARTFERLVIASAPPDVLPPNIAELAAL